MHKISNKNELVLEYKVTHDFRQLKQPLTAVIIQNSLVHKRCLTALEFLRGHRSWKNSFMVDVIFGKEKPRTLKDPDNQFSPENLQLLNPILNKS